MSQDTEEEKIAYTGPPENATPEAISECVKAVWPWMKILEYVVTHDKFSDYAPSNGPQEIARGMNIKTVSLNELLKQAHKMVRFCIWQPLPDNDKYLWPTYDSSTEMPRNPFNSSEKGVSFLSIFSILSSVTNETEFYGIRTSLIINLAYYVFGLLPFFLDVVGAEYNSVFKFMAQGSLSESDRKFLARMAQDLNFYFNSPSRVKKQEKMADFIRIVKAYSLEDFVIYPRIQQLVDAIPEVADMHQKMQDFISSDDLSYLWSSLFEKSWSAGEDQTTARMFRDYVLMHVLSFLFQEKYALVEDDRPTTKEYLRRSIQIRGSGISGKRLYSDLSPEKLPAPTDEKELQRKLEELEIIRREEEKADQLRRDAEKAKSKEQKEKEKKEKAERLRLQEEKLALQIALEEEEERAKQKKKQEQQKQLELELKPVSQEEMMEVAQQQQQLLDEEPVIPFVSGVVSTDQKLVMGKRVPSNATGITSLERIARHELVRDDKYLSKSLEASRDFYLEGKLLSVASIISGDPFDIFDSTQKNRPVTCLFKDRKTLEGLYGLHDMKEKVAFNYHTNISSSVLSIITHLEARGDEALIEESSGYIVIKLANFVTAEKHQFHFHLVFFSGSGFKLYVMTCRFYTGGGEENKKLVKDADKIRDTRFFNSFLDTASYITYDDAIAMTKSYTLLSTHFSIRNKP